MECILLGSGGMMPMPYRMLTSLAIRLDCGDIYVFDAGEGTQVNWKKLRMGVRGLKLIAVTHLHADHCLGIPGLMMLKAQMVDPQPLTILGPPGTEAFILGNQRILEFYLNYPVRFVEWSGTNSALAYEDERVRIYWHPLKHTRFCLGYRLEEVDRPGRFHPERARELGVPEGRLWGKLQSGTSVMNIHRALVRPEDVLGSTRRGRHAAFIVDTRPTENAVLLCQSADIVFLEGMFMPEDEEHADQKGHMTVIEACHVASDAGAKRAVLVHISPRYRNEELDRMEAVAQLYFSNATAGRDLETYSVKHPEETSA